ncbi:MAG TPA: hypothetical protein DCE23_02440 [Firmicutes bacterium]|nr:hypothetical protein [Bacillota bacterium]
MKDIILDTLIDSVKLLPFLFIAFLIIETIEHKLNNKSRNIIEKSGKFGPIIGSILGIIPQCGFSVLATNLYITRIISLGTLIAIYLSTSDEMLPILLANNTSYIEILKIIGIKFIIGIIFGYVIDLLYHKKKDKENYDICSDAHCGCNHNHSLIKSSIVHTIKTLLFITLITFIINILFHYLGEQYLTKIFMKDSLFAPFISSLIGLIPSCGASILITELYLNNAINIGSCISGLLTGSGVALLVLFKSNKDIKENIKILCLLYSIGVICGIIIELITIIL